MQETYAYNVALTCFQINIVKWKEMGKYKQNCFYVTDKQ